jgi:ATP-dependent Clp protease ATP-binding subunit ClpA
VFDRFTDRARKVMGLSRQAAQRLRHDYIAPEHVLIGLVEEGSGVAASVLKNLDVDLRKLRAEVEKLVSKGKVAPTTRQLPFTPRAKRVLELSLEEAENLGHTYIGTEHLLLGLIRETEGIPAQALKSLHVGIEQVRAEVLALLGARPPELERASAQFLPSDGTREWMGAARAEAKRLGHGRVELDHLILATCRMQGPCRPVLAAAGIDLRLLEATLTERMSAWSGSNVEPAPAPSFLRAMAGAKDLAEGLEEPEICELVLLLAVLRAARSTAFAGAISEQNVLPDDIRREILRALAERS